ncbi:hypothetical protein LJC61_04320 [Ruminococcaceae bacterium OttesenSCG-928-A16]|nr:hypothetical protein [Ruminococcaceae bacterium OttesenSCG-928-A16]
MKKFLAIAFSALLALSLVACGGGKKDGVYTAKVDANYAAEAGHGWTDQLTVTYKDGKITEAVFDSINAEGTIKSQTTPETYPMEFHPTEWIPQLGVGIVAAQTADKVEVVAGATHASEAAKALLAGIEKDGKPGETIIVTIPVTA